MIKNCYYIMYIIYEMMIRPSSDIFVFKVITFEFRLLALTIGNRKLETFYECI